MSRWQRSGVLSWKALGATRSYLRQHVPVIGIGVDWQPFAITRNLSSTSADRLRRRKRRKFGKVKIEGRANAGDAITAEGKPIGTLHTVSGDLGIAYLRFDRAEGVMRAGDAVLTRLA